LSVESAAGDDNGDDDSDDDSDDGSDSGNISDEQRGPSAAIPGLSQSGALRNWTCRKEVPREDTAAQRRINKKSEIYLISGNQKIHRRTGFSTKVRKCTTCVSCELRWFLCVGRFCQGRAVLLTCMPCPLSIDRKDVAVPMAHGSFSMDSGPNGTHIFALNLPIFTTL
jgi:hypothetical protein